MSMKPNFGTGAYPRDIRGWDAVETVEDPDMLLPPGAAKALVTLEAGGGRSATGRVGTADAEA